MTLLSRKVSRQAIQASPQYFYFERSARVREYQVQHIKKVGHLPSILDVWEPVENLQAFDHEKQSFWKSGV